MKKYLLLGTILTSLSLFSVSCASSSFVPGEDRVRLQNISSEYFYIAKSYEDLKNWDKAIEFYKLARTNLEIQNACDYGTARCYAYKNDWENALSYYGKLLEQDPENLSLLMSVAYLNAVSGNLDDAKNQYAALLESGVDGVGVYKNYVSVLVVCEKYEEAKAVLAQMEEKYPESSEIEALHSKIDEALNPKTEESESAK